MNQKGLSVHTCKRIAQRMPPEHVTKIVEFHKVAIITRKKNNYDLRQASNMDKI